MKKQPTHFIEVYKWKGFRSEPALYGFLKKISHLKKELKQTVALNGTTIAIFKIYPKSAAIIAAMLITAFSYAQPSPLFQAKIGMNSRLAFTGTIDAGIQLNGAVIAATYAWQGFHSAGIYAGYRIPQWTLYAGYCTQDAKGKQMMLGKPIIVGLSWHDDRGSGMLDFRYMAGAYQFTMGWELGGRD